VCPDYKVVFNEDRLPTSALNLFYNISDVTLNIASNEGFGLSSAESIMAGTPIINNVTGGLQDQVRFENEDGDWIDFSGGFTSNHAGKYKKHGSWAKVVFPSNRSLQGSVVTPYIFDDRCRFEDVAKEMMAWYKTKKVDRDKFAMEGREWLLSTESGMSAAEMCNRMSAAIDECLTNWVQPARFELSRIDDMEPIGETGIIF
jgi:hypothetical protein